MHICYLCDEYPPGAHGGIGAYTQTMARTIVHSGHDATVVGFYQIPEVTVSEDRGVRVIRLPHSPLPWTGLLVHSWRLRQALKKLDQFAKIDVLEGPELSLALLPRRMSMPKIIRMNGGHHFFAVTLGKKPRPWRSWLERRSMGRADAMCAVSRFAAETTRDLLDLGSRDIPVLPNPVDVSHFFCSQQVPEEGCIVFVGTLCQKKGLHELVRAFPAILEAIPSARLVLAGRDSIDPVTGGSYAAFLRQALGHLQDRVEFLGHVDRESLPGVLARASIAVFPSHMETQGIVIVEAMAAGKPVVISKTGPGPEVVDDGVSGLLCDPYDPGSIAEKAILLLRDFELRARMGAAARARAEAVFSNDVLVARTLAYYRQCVRDFRSALSHIPDSHTADVK